MFAQDLLLSFFETRGSVNKKFNYKCYVFDFIHGQAGINTAKCLLRICYCLVLEEEEV